MLRSVSGPNAKSVQVGLEQSARATAGRRAATDCRLLAISVRWPMYPARSGGRSLRSRQQRPSRLYP